MKVTNNSVGGAHGHIESGKAGKADATKGVKHSSKGGASAGADALKGDSKVAVSQRAQMMQKAKDIASDSSIDEAKVARLQKMIDEGTYKTDAGAIADKLVEEHMLIPD